MENRLIIYREKDAVVTAEFRDNALYEIAVSGRQGTVVPGNIYIAQVEKIIPGIQAAFIRMPGEEENWYLPFDKSRKIISDPTHADGQLHSGDQILVQVEKEAGKNKTVTAIGDFSLTGCYFVLMHGKTGVHRSSKIGNQEFLDRTIALVRQEMGAQADYAVMIRTNAEGTEEEVLLRELRYLQTEYLRIVSSAKNRKTGTLLYAGLPRYLCALRDTYQQNYDKILTDDSKIYEEIKQYLSASRPEMLPTLKLYDGSACSLASVYNMKAHFNEILSQKVWLKSGAYLVIQQTEAMAVIDVNTGKATDSGKRSDGILQCNLEAAKEIARQIRLRNLSGIIMVDFIDMKKTEDNHRLMGAMEEAVASDRIKTTVVDMTKLHLVEITRTKVLKPLAEQMREIGL